jgi:hypothetical protein
MGKWAKEVDGVGIPASIKRDGKYEIKCPYLPNHLSWYVNLVNNNSDNKTYGVSRKKHYVQA